MTHQAADALPRLETNGPEQGPVDGDISILSIEEAPVTMFDSIGGQLSGGFCKSLAESVRMPGSQ